MARKQQPPQLSLAFARPKRTKGGLEIDDYQGLVEKLRNDARTIAHQFKLPEFDIDADRPDARSRYGLCFSDGRIRVRLVNVRTGHKLKYSALIDTVVHELAHLRYMNHGPRWESLYRRMLEWARKQGIYEPRIAGAVDLNEQARHAEHVLEVLAGAAEAKVEQLALFAPPRPAPPAGAVNRSARSTG